MAGGIGKIMEVDQNQDGKPDLAQRFHFEPFLSTLFFNGNPLPKQQEIIDRVFADEKNWIEEKIVVDGQIGKIWEIGNEPNWFPLMRPAQYAAIYARYYELIKGIDPSAKCMIGGLFLHEAIENPRDIVAAMIPEFFGIFREELATFVSQSLFSTSTTTAWYEAFLAALPEGVKVDIGNFHLYPMRANATAFQLAEVQPHLEKLAASFTAHNTTEIWVTEFGNIDWRRSEQEAAQLCWQLSNYFISNQVGITRWFWSRSVGYDHRFDAIGQRPLSALFAADGKTLNSIGRIYKIASDLNARKAVDIDLAASPQSSQLPQRLALSPSYPNPFAVSKNAPARIPYALPAESEVRLQVFDVLGRLTREIVRARQTAGTYEALWDGRNAFGGSVTSGIYFVVLNAGEQIKTQKIVVTR
jgi:hypothetical protein